VVARIVVKLWDFVCKY